MQVAVIAGNGMVNGHQVRAGRKGAFDLEFDERRGYRGEDVPAAEHSLAERHEVGDGVDAIADELPRFQSVDLRRRGFAERLAVCTSCKLDDIRAYRGRH